jgi:hypothetical protein
VTLLISLSYKVVFHKKENASEKESFKSY